MTASTIRKTPGRAWKPGQSGNPAGRRPGTGKIAALRAAIEADVPAIVDMLRAAALNGDMQAARLLLERVVPTVKPVELTVPVALPAAGTLTEQGRAVLAAVAAGELAPGQGSQMLGALGTLAKLVEHDELTHRIEALEARFRPGEVAA